MADLTVKLPDGSPLELPAGATGADAAAVVGPRLARDALAVRVDGELRDLAAERVSEVCVVPIAFVSDHVETLGEIDHEARQESAALGIKQFEMTAGLNDSPTFIAALAELVENALGLGQGVTDRLVAAD